jgi:hypothetical protein
MAKLITAVAATPAAAPQANRAKTALASDRWEGFIRLGGCIGHASRRHGVCSHCGMEHRQRKQVQHSTQSSAQPAAAKHVKPGKADSESSKAISKRPDARQPHDRDGNEQQARAKRH